MKVEYLADIGTLDITLKEGAKSVRTDEIAPDFLVDFDEDGEVIGIEILNAGTKYEVSSLSTGGMLLNLLGNVVVRGIDAIGTASMSENQVERGAKEARR